MLDIQKNIEGEKAVLTLSGRIDSNTARDLEREVKAALDGVTDFTLDMEKIEYISSAGLRVLLAAQKQMNKQGKMTIRNVKPEIMEIFEVTGFVDILNIEE